MENYIGTFKMGPLETPVFVINDGKLWSISAEELPFDRTYLSPKEPTLNSAKQAAIAVINMYLPVQFIPEGE